MKFRLRAREEIDINLIPLIDVVLMLLVFFMLTTTFRKEADLEVQLPQASARPSPGAAERLELGIDAQGRYYLGGRPLADTARETLTSALAPLAEAAQTEQPFTIRADARTAHAAVVMAMDVAGELGFKRIAIATEHGSD